MNLSEFKDNYFYGLVGPNASGKTSFLKKIIKDNDKNIAYFFYDEKVYKKSDVYNEILESINNKDISNDNKKIIKLFSLFDYIYLLDKKCIDLTEEEKQIIGIFSALINNPKYLILDNSFSMMKYEVKNNIIKLLKTLKITIILATSNLDDILQSDYLYVIDNNNIIIEGKTKSVLEKDTYLKNLGLEIPFSIDLSLKLKFYEIYNKTSTDYNEVIEKLWN